MGLSIYPKWFEVNVHDAKGMSGDDVRKLLRSKPDTELNERKKDDDGKAVGWAALGSALIMFESG